jgi:DNA-binding CsgD family transcriptional regulator
VHVDTTDVVGRDAELSAIADFVASIEQPSALLLEGEAGIGKTTLWRSGVEAAEERSYRVLSCRPAGSEVRLAYAALGDLVDEVLDDVLPELPAPRRRALQVGLLFEDPADRPPDQRAVSLAVLELIRLLARDGPVLLAIDDVQWLDASSALALSFALRRLELESVGALVAERREGRFETPLELDRTFGERLRRLEVGPLSVGALHRLLGASLGSALPRPTLLRVHEAAAGNPFFALEIARALARHGQRVKPGAPLPIRDNLEALVQERLTGLPGASRRVLEYASALADPAVELLERAAGGQVNEALESAVAAGVATLEGDRVFFAHPLLSSALYSGMSDPRRGEVHRELAAIADEPEQQARHLALATTRPDEDVASILDEGARRARARGATAAAAELAERAMGLTPETHVAERRSRALLAARHHFDSGAIPTARSLMEAVLADSSPGPERAEALQHLADVSPTEMQQSLLRQALREPDLTDQLRAAINHELAWLLTVTEGPLAAIDPARTAVRSAEAINDPTLLALPLACLAQAEFLAGLGSHAAPLERALRLQAEGEDYWTFQYYSPSLVHASLLVWQDEFELARQTFESLRQLALERGDDQFLGVPLFWLAQLECRAENWRLALELARESDDLTAQTTLESQQAATLAYVALVSAYLGDVEGAREAAEEGLAIADRAGYSYMAILNLHALGFLELSLGNARAAHAFLHRAAMLKQRLGFGEPRAMPLGPDYVESAVAMGDLAEAERAATELEDSGRRLGRAWALATGARCRGLVAAARGEADDALDAFEEALAAHGRLPLGFERARTLVAQGATLRRIKRRRDARESLDQALAIFEEMGARLWAEKARAELARIGGRAPSAGALTPTEERVAELVAEGRANKEVARELFVTVKTVERNLSRVYEKLGIRSRAELARRYAREERATKP